jgi:hypothetical protein
MESGKETRRRMSAAIYRIHKLATDPFIYVINKEKPACHPLGHIVACGLIVEIDVQVAQAEVRLGVVH